MMVWRAMSASDSTDEWPYWYVTDDLPLDRNKLIDALECISGKRPVGMPFVTRAIAECIAKQMNAMMEARNAKP